MNIREQINELELNEDNCIVIGSGILNALGIRESHDIDLVVDQETYNRFKQDPKYKAVDNHDREVLENGVLEIGTSWKVLGKEWKLKDFTDKQVIDGVSYVSLNFVIEVKKAWAQEAHPRQKDLDDIFLIERYLKNQLN